MQNDQQDEDVFPWGLHLVARPFADRRVPDDAPPQPMHYALASDYTFDDMRNALL